MTGRLTGAAAVLVVVVGFAATAGATGLMSGKAPRASSAGVQLAGLFGESDEEKAARLREDNQDAQITDLKRRVQDLEQSLQQLTGQNEVLSHRVRELSERLDRQQKDSDYKLCTLSAQLLGVGTTSDQSGNGLPCDTVGSAAPASGGVLGTLPQEAVPDTRSQYDAALNLLARAQYDEARAAFQTFADSFPKDELAAKAVYWTGYIAYVQKDYMGAAQAFVEVIKKYPNSADAPASMLKLGQSLLALGQKKNGCTTLGELKRKYPHAPTAVLSQAASTRAESCR
jgi:tol-pal system protein YbgF